MSLRERLGTLRTVVPDGTGAVGAGLVVSSLTAYVFVVLSLNSLDEGAKAAFSAFWAVIFVAGPGFFLPLEQEVGRALAHRRAQGIGGRPLVVKAARIGALVTGILVVGSLALLPVLSDRIYKGDRTFAVALVVGLVAFYLLHLARGVLAGEGRFRAYGELLAADGVLRLGLAIGLVLLSVERGGLFALCLGVAPFLALPIALRGQRSLLKPGPDAPYSELSVNLGWLLAASVLTQALAYAPLLGVNLLADASDEVIVAGFASAFFVARVPVIAFQAVQGTLLPKLAGLAGAGQHDEFRRGFMKLMVLVITFAVAGAVGAFTLGPTVGGILFTDFTMSAGNLGLLAAGSGMFIVALTSAQALMALGNHRFTALSWGTGLIVAVIGMSFVEDLELRVELGFLVGSAATAVLMIVGLLRRQKQMIGVGTGPLIDALEHEPIEL